MAQLYLASSTIFLRRESRDQRLDGRNSRDSSPVRTVEEVQLLLGLKRYIELQSKLSVIFQGRGRIRGCQVNIFYWPRHLWDVMTGIERADDVVAGWMVPTTLD